MSSTALSLSLSLSQVTKPQAPDPTVRVTVENTSTHETYTILKWSSPLDPLALPLGLISVNVPSKGLESGTSFEIPKIMLKRMMPPPEDAFVTLAPGESKSHDVVFRDPAIDMDKLIGNAKEASLDGNPVINVQLICGTNVEDDDDEQGGAIVWPGKRREDLSDEDVQSLDRRGGQGSEAVRWKVASNVLKVNL